MSSIGQDSSFSLKSLNDKIEIQIKTHFTFRHMKKLTNFRDSATKEKSPFQALTTCYYLNQGAEVHVGRQD